MHLACPVTVCNCLHDCVQTDRAERECGVGGRGSKISLLGQFLDNLGLPQLLRSSNTYDTWLHSLPLGYRACRKYESTFIGLPRTTMYPLHIRILCSAPGSVCDMPISISAPESAAKKKYWQPHINDGFKENSGSAGVQLLFRLLVKHEGEQNELECCGQCTSQNKQFYVIGKFILCSFRPEEHQGKLYKDKSGFV